MISDEEGRFCTLPNNENNKVLFFKSSAVLAGIYDPDNESLQLFLASGAKFTATNVDEGNYTRLMNHLEA